MMTETTTGKSTVQVGTEFEMLAGVFLEHQDGIEKVERVGGGGDEGIDLRAEWDGVQVVVQCKALAGKVSTAAVRDLEGVMGRMIQTQSLGGDDNGVLGVLVSKSGFSSATLAYLASPAAVFPVLALNLKDEETLTQAVASAPVTQSLFPNLIFASTIDPTTSSRILHLVNNGHILDTRLSL